MFVLHSLILKHEIMPNLTFLERSVQGGECVVLIMEQCTLISRRNTEIHKAVTMATPRVHMGEEDCSTCFTKT